MSKKIKTVDLVGRDPTCGRTLARSGPHLTWKDKIRNRKSKLYRKFLRYCTLEE